MGRISVVIPTYQRRDSVQRALSALARQTLPPGEYEVIVSIDGSEDGTREMVAGFQAPYALRGLWQPNRGRAAACNTGICQARGEVLVLLDDDMEPAPECLIQHLRAHPDGSRRGVMGAAPIYFDETVPPIVAYIGTKFNQHLEKLSRPGYRLTLRDFYSGNFSIRREVLLAMGGFDEAFRVYGNEDLELSLRLTRAGVILVYNTEALASQHYTKDFSTLARDTIAKGRTAVLLASKYPETFPDLQLALYAQGSHRWRWLRAGLVALSRIWAGTPNAVIAFISWLEGRRPKQLPLFYRLALDYCYWLGAQAALRENRRIGRGLTSLRLFDNMPKSGAWAPPPAPGK
ncbi:MAG: glycosyltransferase family 2 protein [Chloroflexota bacterium]